jgi:hypothetical protein
MSGWLPAIPAGAMSLAEPEVALSDLVLAIIATCSGVLIARLPVSAAARPLRQGFVLLFSTLAAAALLGALDHGVLRPAGGAAHAITWSATLLLVGALGAIAALIAGRLLLLPRGVRLSEGAAALLMITLTARIISGGGDFSLAIAAYLLPALWLLITLIWLGLHGKRSGALTAAAGVALNLAASAIQRFGVGSGDDWLGHNTLYHFVAGAGFLLIAVGARHMLNTPESPALNERVNPET